MLNFVEIEGEGHTVVTLISPFEVSGQKYECNCIENKELKILSLGKALFNTLNVKVGDSVKITRSLISNFPHYSFLKVGEKCH